jgi:hypothetical protein
MSRGCALKFRVRPPRAPSSLAVEALFDLQLGQRTSRQSGCSPRAVDSSPHQGQSSTA